MKNKSKTIKNGTRIQTIDEYIDKSGYVSPGHPNKNDLYRGTYVVDTNKDNELAIIELTTHGGKSPKGTTGDYVKVFDCNGKPIKVDDVRFVIKKEKD